MSSSSQHNLFFGDQNAVHGTFEKFHARNVHLSSDATVRLHKEPDKRVVTLAVGSSEAPETTHLVVADKFRGRSDFRLKSCIKPLHPTACLDTVSKLTGKSYRFKNADRKSFGMIAQDVREILPEIVSEDGDGFLNISYLELIPFLVESIKETNRKLDELTERVLSGDFKN